MQVRIRVRCDLWQVRYHNHLVMHRQARQAAADLYRCAVGYVGVYDLPRLTTENRRQGRWARTWTGDWLGTDTSALASASPNRLAERIRVPVLLVAGGEDLVAPIEHSHLMERALRRAGVPVETLYYPNEGHGFTRRDNRITAQDAYLAFLDKHVRK